MVRIAQADLNGVEARNRTLESYVFADAPCG
jgi:hypothetical protein